MDCEQLPQLGNEDYIKRFNEKVTRQRIPLSGSIDITHRCNLSCIHCYIGEKGPIFREEAQRELDSARWISIIDEITEAGCLYLLITGGEPLLRPDFPIIYEHAKKRGLLITLFTSGTLIDRDIIKLFEKFPPYNLEISLYGATPETYEKITGTPGSYQNCIDGIESLLKLGINITLKTMLMTANRHEYFAIEEMAKKYNTKFRFDPALFPTFNGEKSPTKLRISPKEAVEKEFSDSDRTESWVGFSKRMSGSRLSDKLYNCGAGLNLFHIDPYGMLQPCLMVKNINFDLSKASFMEGWRGAISGISKMKANKDFACLECDKMIYCGYCPAFFDLENGSEQAPSKYLCALGENRLNKIEENQTGPS